MTIAIRKAGLVALAITMAGAAMTLLPPYPAALAIWSMMVAGR